MSSNEPAAEESSERPLLDHLVELRTRLLRCVMVIGVIFLGLYFIRQRLYEVLAEPLQAALPAGSNMIATEVATPFLIPLKLALFTAFFVSIPYVLYQLWAFIAPGLYRNEKRFVWPMLGSSVALFYVGMAFAYFVVFPLIFKFFAGQTGDDISMMTDISAYLSFVLMLFFAFGAAFEVPIVTILLVRTGITTRQALAAKRPYVIVGAFAVGMLLTPPDVLSQVLLAIPIWLLYELGILLSGLFAPSSGEAAD
jgi:sec-independent protein translocase protein TatC